MIGTDAVPVGGARPSFLKPVRLHKAIDWQFEPVAEDLAPKWAVVLGDGNST